MPKLQSLSNRGFTDPGSLDHSSFINWMNRPLARAQVTVYQYALKVLKDDLQLRFHCLPRYRDQEVTDQRNAIAARLKEIRRETGRSKLWRYDMQTGNYAL